MHFLVPGWQEHAPKLSQLYLNKDASHRTSASLLGLICTEYITTSNNVFIGFK